MKTQRVDTWVAALEDKPGTGVVFMTPIKGARQTKAATAAGLRKTTNLHTLRLEGADKPGLGARITKALADAGINLRGLSAAAIGRRFAGHVAVDSEADAAKVARILRAR